MNAAFVTLPQAGGEVSINVDEIAAMRSHVVTSYSYVDYTEITLKCGKVFDCAIKKSEVEARLARIAGPEVTP